MEDRPEWKMKERCPKEFVEQFPQYPGYVLQLLWSRGVRDANALDEYFNPDYVADIRDPFLVKNMIHAVERIVRAVEGGEKIVIYGDYDADGICASSVLYKVFKEAGVETEVYIPDRFKEGYGLNLKSVEAIISNGARLIITVDCGITDITEIELCNSRGVDVIVTDHHLPLAQVPAALTILDAKQHDETYPFKDFCGTGMAFKLACALLTKDYFASRINKGFEKWLLDLVAVATVADMMPLLGENRTLVIYGLRVIGKTKWPGLAALVKNALFQKKRVRAEDIAFVIGPRLNAASRMGHATTSFELLNVSNAEEIASLIEHLEEMNKDRRALVDNIQKEIEKKLNALPVVPPVICEASAEWPSSILGLVSSRLTETHYRPSFLFSIDEEKGTARGSCRSAPGFNLVEAMDECKDLLIEFGGHANAGGLNLAVASLPDFAKRMSDIYAQHPASSRPAECLMIDCELAAEDTNGTFAKDLSDMEPFGEGNEEPVFLMRNLMVADIKEMSNGRHVKLKLRGMIGGASAMKIFSAMVFNAKERHKDIMRGDNIDVVFSVSENTYNGITETFFRVIDLRRSSEGAIKI
jgi:single-stranded-DNA-specific exonuclease